MCPRPTAAGLAAELQAALDERVVGLALHTDVVRTGILAGTRTAPDLMQAYQELLAQALQGRPLWLPTFNYDFARTRRFDVAADPCQVGSLNEHLRQAYPDRRTHCPIFSFLALDTPDLDRRPPANVFGPGSSFAELARRRFHVGFLGVGLEACTFLHHAEEIAAVGYRYLKRFEGVVVAEGLTTPVAVDFRVRPLAGAVAYDWPRLEADLLAAGLLSKAPAGQGRLLLLEAAATLAYWQDRLAADESYFLTPASREAVAALAATHGYPFGVAMEGA